jgi:putative membrane protein
MNRTFCIPAIAALVGGALFAQDPRVGTPLSEQDRAFIQDAAKANQDEINLGKLAQQKSSNPQVKSYGQTLVNDHTKNLKELENLAAKKGVSVEPNQGATARSEYQLLQGMSSAMFDRSFVSQMEQDHEKAISMFEQALKDTQDPDLRNYINSTLPVLRKHLTEARDIERNLNKG